MSTRIPTPRVDANLGKTAPSNSPSFRLDALAPLARQLEAELHEQTQLVTHYQRHMREKIFVDASPGAELPTRILSAHIEDCGIESRPPGIGQMMSEWQAERNAIIRAALEDLSEAPHLRSSLAASQERVRELEEGLVADAEEHESQAKLWTSIDDPENADYHQKRADALRALLKSNPANA